MGDGPKESTAGGKATPRAPVRRQSVTLALGPGDSGEDGDCRPILDVLKEEPRGVRGRDKEPSGIM